MSETLESIRRQTHSDWEVILVEDASPEPSRDIVEAFAECVSQNVTYIASTTNQGSAVSRHLSISRAANPVIAMMDSDDYWLPNHLESLAKCFQSKDTEFAFSGFQQFTNDPQKPSATYAPVAEHLNDLRVAYFYRRFFIQPSSCAFTREIYDRVGNWHEGLTEKPAWLPNRNHAEDRNFLQRVIHRGVKLTWTGEATSCYRKHLGSTTHCEEIGHPDRVWFYNYYGLITGTPVMPQRRFLAYLNNTMGRDLMGSAPRLASWYLFKSWQWYPLRIDRLARAILAFIMGLFSGLKSV